MRAERTQQMRDLIYRIFGVSEEGKTLLKLLEEFYLYAPVANVQAPEWYAYYRDGENNVIRMILRIIESVQSQLQAKKSEVNDE